MRELVGEDGHAIAEYMLSVLSDETQRTADRMETAKWLADRGFGKAALLVDVSGGSTEQAVMALLEGLSTEDLESMWAILEKYVPVPAELTDSEELRFGSGSVGIAASPG